MMDDNNGKDSLQQTPDGVDGSEVKKSEDQQSTIFVKHVYNTKKPAKRGGVKRILICVIALVLCGALIGSVFLVKRMLPNDAASGTTSVPEESTITVLKYSDIVKSSNIEIDGKSATVDINIESVHVVNGYEEFTLLPFFTAVTKEDSDSSSEASDSSATTYETGWSIEDIDKSKTSSDAISDTVEDLLTVKAFREMENTFDSVEAYHEHFGMEENLTAGAVIRFNDGTEELMVRVGDILATGDAYYLRTSLSDTVYAVKAEEVEAFFSSIKEMADGTVIETIEETDKNTAYFQAGSLARFDKIKISGEVFDGKTYEFVMSEDISADYMPYRMTVPYSRPASDDFIASVLGLASEGVSASAFYSYKMTADEKKEYGFENPKCVIELTVADYSFKLTVGGFRDDGTESLTAIVEGKEQVFGIDQDDLAFLINASNDVTKMFNINFIMEDIYTVESVEFKLNSENHRFDIKHIPREDDEDVKDTEVKLGNSTIDTQTFKLLYQRVLMLSLLEFVTEVERTEPILTVTFNYIEDYDSRVVEFTESPDDIYHYVAWVDGTPLGEVLKGGVDELMECVDTCINGGTITDTWS